MASFDRPTDSYGILKLQLKLLREGLDENDINKITKAFDRDLDPYVRFSYHNLLRICQERNPDISPINDPLFREYVQYWILKGENLTMKHILPPNIKAEYSREKSALASSLPQLPREIKETIGSYSHAGGKRRKKRRTNKRRRVNKRTRNSRV